MEDGYDAVKLDFTLYDRDKKDIPNRDCEGFVSTDFYDMVEERIAAIRETCGNVDITWKIMVAPMLLLLLN